MRLRTFGRSGGNPLHPAVFDNKTKSSFFTAFMLFTVHFRNVLGIRQMAEKLEVWTRLEEESSTSEVLIPFKFDFWKVLVTQQIAESSEVRSRLEEEKNYIERYFYGEKFPILMC